MPTTVIDIETASLPTDKLPPFDESKVAVGNLKDPAKIKEKIEEARQKWLDQAALSPLTGQVVLVGLEGNHRGILAAKDFENGEPEMLEVALGVIRDEVYAGNIIAGFNILGFDIPFLVKRAWAHNIKMPVRLREGRYWHKNLLDLREVWLMGEYGPAPGTSSLNVVARHLGYDAVLCEDKYDPSMNLEQLREHLKKDLAKTLFLWERLMA